MTAALTRLDSAPEQVRGLGATVESLQVLDVMERLLQAARHPDIVTAERYGPGLGPWGPSKELSKVATITGVKVVYQSTATASLWEALWPGENVVPMPAVMPPPSQRAPRLAIFVAQLLDYAKPERFRAWRLVSLPDIGMSPEQDGMPFGLSVALADGTKTLLRATATGPTNGREPSEEPFPDYVIPEGVRTCLQAVSAASAER